MSFFIQSVPRYVTPRLPSRTLQRRGLGDDATDFPGMYTNPDGTLTYDGAPYDAYDPANPYNYSDAAATPALPTSIPLQTTSIGTSPIAASGPAPLTNYGVSQTTGITSTGLPPAIPALPSVSGITGFINSISSLFKGGPSPVAVPLSPSGGALPLYAPRTSTIGGISTSTLLLLGLAVGAAVLIGKKRNAPTT